MRYRLLNNKLLFVAQRECKATVSFYSFREPFTFNEKEVY